MTTGLVGPVTGRRSERSRTVGLRDYFWSDTPRAVQTVLGLIWLLDGGLQFQSFMYSHGFVAMLLGNARGQPAWVHASIIWGARLANGDIGLWNTLFALVQVAIGLGILYRPLTRLALLGSLAWVLIVWGFGEGFGLLLTNAAQPLTGAPGGVLLYGLIGLVAWPGAGPGGRLGVRGAKTMWCALWVVVAWLWLLGASSAPDATRGALTTVPSGIRPLDSLRATLANASGGHGLVIALALAALSAAIGIAVAADWHPRSFLGVSIALNLVYWVIAQGFGGIFAGGATDPNSGLPFVLLACALYPLFPRGAARAATTAGALRIASATPGELT